MLNFWALFWWLSKRAN